MKVKLKHDFNYVDIDEEHGTSSIVFEKDTLYDVVHQFEHPSYGKYDHTVYVVTNGCGETMSISKEVCIHCEDDVFQKEMEYETT